MSELAEVAPGDWDGLLERLGLDDAYLTRSYVESAREIEPGVPAYLHLRTTAGDAVFAAIVRDELDVTTPYGYGGPVASGAAAGADFWQAYDRWCARRGLVASFFRFHPLFQNHRYAGAGVQLERPGRTVSWPLGGDLLAGLHPTHRNKVRKAIRAGAAIAIREAPVDLDAFARLYEETMSRLGAASAYYFPATYWERLAQLGPRLWLANAEAGGELAASALLLAGPRWLHYHLSASSELGRRSGASNLLLYEAACRAQERGLQAFHLGGGLGGKEDSLFAFKSHFAPGSLVEPWFGKAVHDVPRYLELCGATTLSFEGRFPAYRR